MAKKKSIKLSQLLKKYNVTDDVTDNNPKQYGLGSFLKDNSVDLLKTAGGAALTATGVAAPIGIGMMADGVSGIAANEMAPENPELAQGIQVAGQVGSTIASSQGTPMANGGELTQYQGGGTHEQNPNGGIDVGPNAQVEENETRWEDYIFSDRIKPAGKKYSYAEASKRIEKKYSKRKNDKYDDEAKEYEMKGLMAMHEADKKAMQTKQAEEFQAAYGGDMNQMSNGGGIVDNIKPLSSYEVANVPGQVNTEQQTMLGDDGNIMKVSDYNKLNPVGVGSKDPVTYDSNTFRHFTEPGQYPAYYAGTIDERGNPIKDKQIQANQHATNKENVDAYLDAANSRSGYSFSGSGDQLNINYSTEGNSMGRPIQSPIDSKYSNEQRSARELAASENAQAEALRKSTKGYAYGGQLDYSALQAAQEATTTPDIGALAQYAGPQGSLVGNPTAQGNEINAGGYTQGNTPPPTGAAIGDKGWQDYATLAAQNAGNIYNTVQGMRGQEDVQLGRVNPKMVNYSAAINNLNKQYDQARNISNERIRGNATGSGQALSNMIAGNTALSSNKADAMSKIIEQEQNQNVGITNQGQVTNLGQSNREEDINARQDAVQQEALASGLSGIGSSIAGFNKDNKAYDAQGRTIENMDTSDFKFDPITGKAISKKTGK